MMIDFSLLKHKNKTYGGANGSKRCVVYNGNDYMIKFPPLPTKNKEMSYANSCISEYIGCHIFESIGIPVQETLLGIYTLGDKKKIVVACKDMVPKGYKLQDFASLKNQVIDSIRNGYGTDLNDILTTFEEQTALDPITLSTHFWDIFIADALIGNWDRHNGNWGFLYNEDTDEMILAPLYDCGSSLYPQADEKLIANTLSNQAERNLRIYSIPTSSITLNGKRINYFDFISSLEYEGCNEALKRIIPRINMEKIYSIIDNTPFITNTQKEFYKIMLKERKEKILDYSLERLIKKEKDIEEGR